MRAAAAVPHASRAAPETCLPACLRSCCLPACPQLEVKGRLALQRLDHFLSELRHSRSRTGARALPPVRHAAHWYDGALVQCCRRATVGGLCFAGSLSIMPLPARLAAVTLGLLSPAADCSPEERAALQEVGAHACVLAAAPRLANLADRCLQPARRAPHVSLTKKITKSTVHMCASPRPAAHRPVLGARAHRRGLPFPRRRGLPAPRLRHHRAPAGGGARRGRHAGACCTGCCCGYCCCCVKAMCWCIRAAAPALTASHAPPPSGGLAAAPRGRPDWGGPAPAVHHPPQGECAPERHPRHSPCALST